MDTKNVYVVVSGDDYGGQWCEPTEWQKVSNTCDNCGNKLFIPKVFHEKCTAEEYVERYLNSYVDCCNGNSCWCKNEIRVFEIQIPYHYDNHERLYITVSSAPYGGALEQQCFECDGTEFMMKVFNDKEQAVQHINRFIQVIAPPCKSCMYNYDFAIHKQKTN